MVIKSRVHHHGDKIISRFGIREAHKRWNTINESSAWKSP